MRGPALPFQSQNGNYPPSTRRNRPLAGQGKPRCCWCGQRLTGQHTITCSPSCKSQLSRAKKRLAVLTLCEIGMPRHVADRLIAAVGLPQIEAKLNALGWQWQPAARAWVRAGARGRILQEAA